VAKAAAPVDVDVHYVKAETGRGIAAWADQHGVDPLVIGTVGRAGLSGFLVGNTAENVIAQAQGGVVAVKA
jgi:nucleotide-binding universal stress UspA family protein